MEPVSLVHTLINQHFCIKDATIDDVFNSLEVKRSKKILLDNKFDWDFLFDEKIWNTQKRFILFDKVNQWTYLQWNVNDFEETKRFAQLLSKKLDTAVYYFFIDPWVFTCMWVLAEKGILTKVYFEYQDEIIHDEGYLEAENVIRITLKKEGEDEFWEDKYWQLYETICQPISILNTKESIKAIKGTLK